MTLSITTDPTTPPAPADDGAVAACKDLPALIKGKNINETSYLATDYLNHFGEVIMLLELIPDMPECFDDLKDWQPKSYAEHFRDSGFQHADVIILAYENAPEQFRQSFDDTVTRLNRATHEGLAKIEGLLGPGDGDQLSLAVAALAGKLNALSDRASGIINGQAETACQSTIDDIMDA